MRSSAHEVVSRLIAGESTSASHPDAAAIAATVLLRVSANLSRFLGSDGCLALFLRARAQAEATHPALKNIRIVAHSDLAVHGVAESTAAFGAAETAAGLESTLVTLIELLGRLIGDDLAMKIVEQNPPDGALQDDSEGAQ